MRVRRGVAAAGLALAGLVGLTGCASSGGEPRSPAGPRSSSPSASPTLAATDRRTVDIYVAVLRQQLEVEGEVFTRNFLGRTPRGAREPLPVAVQTTVSAALQGRFEVTWVDSAGEDVPKDIPVDGRLVSLPALPASGDRFRVSVDDVCGNVCGHNRHYVVSRHGGRWRAVLQQGTFGIA